ncbi:MAG: hypothetical protein Q8918_00975 [Bacteroidota bacterium]|nr:hypothetical protein [Bacteroidota bacterium]MDP4211433.1 hypothetical protein [Bacteroidota bacterium]MDP4248660.1 hypothetical protein [Bacteroidota bacterium]
MERLQHLISKLNEQSEQKDSPLQMLVTLKQIEAELTHMHTVTVTGRKNPGVSVVMPSLNITHRVLSNHDEEKESGVVTRKEILEPVPRPDPVTAPQPWMGDPLVEVPTLSHQAAGQELNDLIGSGSPSINDRLKENGSVDRGSQLKGSPVKELRKAIGVNDRFVFINELFRGDEPMYERSIKTINNFRILPEAEYWMERELKIKLGWDDTREIVKHFYQLVSRRFS